MRVLRRRAPPRSRSSATSSPSGPSRPCARRSTASRARGPARRPRRVPRARSRARPPTARSTPTRRPTACARCSRRAAGCSARSARCSTGPGLTAAGAALTGRGGRAARRTCGSPAARRADAAFEPVLLERVPECAAAYLGVRGAARLVRLLERLGAGGTVDALRELVARRGGRRPRRRAARPARRRARPRRHRRRRTTLRQQRRRAGRDAQGAHRRPAADREARSPGCSSRSRAGSRCPARVPASGPSRSAASTRSRCASRRSWRRPTRSRHDGVVLSTAPAGLEPPRGTLAAAPGFEATIGEVPRAGRLASLPRLAPAPRARRADRPDGDPQPRDGARRPASGARGRRRRHRRPHPSIRHDRGAVPPDPMSQYADNEYLFTSESVTEGHPDKVADQISDGVLDAVLRDDPYGRVACETLVNTGLVVVSGEISTNTYVDIQEIARETIRKIGYTDADLGFSADSCAVINAIDKQSPDIAQGVDQAYEARADASDDDRARRRRRGRPGDDVRLRVERDRRADAAADRAGAQARAPARRRAQGRGRAVPAARTARRRCRCATATGARSRSRSC